MRARGRWHSASCSRITSSAVAVEALQPWVTAQALQEVTMREGQTLTRLAIHYKVENAAVKALRIRLPGITEEQAGTVRGTGAAVSDLASPRSVVQRVSG